jgi:hypothetical protein
MVWRRGAEALTLTCFSKDARPPSAETLVIEHAP